jgi:hypothetical protein
MLFPLLKAWLKPLFSSALSSTGAASKRPSGFRTIGGGAGGSSGAGQRRKHSSLKQHVTDNLSFSESEDQIVNNVKMHDLGAYAGSAAPSHRPSKGIVVSNEFKIVEDEISQNGDQNAKYVTQESW